jgi:hypothetical protein
MLLVSEAQRVMNELGYSGLTLSALPYAFDGVTQIFLQVLQPYIQQGNLTTSSTVVPATSTPQLATLVVPNISSNPTSGPTTMAVGDILIVDQDLAQERSHIQTITGTGPYSITCLLQNMHVGTYPVTVEGGESLVRLYLRECIYIQQRISASQGRFGVKKADEVEFFATTSQQIGTRGELLAMQSYWRDELAVVCGLENLRKKRPSACGGQIMTNF